ncbi:PAS domain-containing sensor histidine kinase [Arcobacter vandammei]|uniref:PAS domain-containing sensor histidine kinase n=1 Tax=Arcobacter vandammei TaxID=2782243 RepID=UPI0018DF425E|nr:ATP-binding protein [Arcobacter vandammei]
MSNISLSKFDAICSTVDNGIILLNKNLEVEFWNRWLEIRTGIQASQIIGKKLADFYSNIDEKRLNRKIITALKLNSPTFYTPQTNNFLLNIELSKIADKVFDSMRQSITITPLDIENGLVILYVYDVTMLCEINHKLQNAKDELIEKNEEMSLIFDTTMEAIILFKDEKIINCNKIAIDLFHKKSRNELIGKKFDSIIKDKEISNKIDNKPIETTIIREDNSKFEAIINIKYTPINDQIFKILTIVDIEELKRKESLLAEQSKLAAMGEMIGNIAHQWRQPLNIISIAASNLNLKKDLGQLEKDDLDNSLNLILKTTEHLSNTIDTFNDFFKQNKDKALFCLKDNIESNILLINSFFRKYNIDIFIDVDENISIYGVANEFSQALINILNNSKDALIQNIDENELRIIKIRAKVINNRVQITIIDNALGIKTDIINKIFEPYFTTKHQYQGTGLGLYMTRQIITISMKGEILAENSHFKHNGIQYFGAKFIITLPLNLD